MIVTWYLPINTINKAKHEAGKQPAVLSTRASQSDNIHQVGCTASGVHRQRAGDTASFSPLLCGAHTALTLFTSMSNTLAVIQQLNSCLAVYAKDNLTNCNRPSRQPTEVRALVLLLVELDVEPPEGWIIRTVSRAIPPPKCNRGAENRLVLLVLPLMQSCFGKL